MLAPAERVALYANKPEQRRDKALDLIEFGLFERNGIFGSRRVRSGHRTKDIKRHTGLRTWCVDRHVALRTQLPNPAGCDARSGKPGLPQVRHRRWIVVISYPRGEIRCRQVRKCEQQIAHIPFGVDDERRDVGEQRFFKHDHAEAGLA